MGWLERMESSSEVDSKALTIVTEDGFIPKDQFSSQARYYSGATGNALDANVVMSPINWIMRNFTEAEAVVEVRRGDTWVRDDENALTTLLMRPNPFYGDALLWKATVVSFCLDGNGYWQKVRNAFGQVLGFWYLPHFLVEPKWPDDGSAFISHYEYRPISGQQPIPIPVRDIVHFRFGLDPANVRKGMSPVRPLLREVFTDEEASMFSAAILGNMGVPGGVIAPSSNEALPSQADVDAMKLYMQNFRGNRRGDWLVLGNPTKIDQFGFDPNNLMLGNLRDIAEERVCAALGVPAAVVGFGAGLQQTKVGATMRELRKEAWNSCVRPMQNDMAKQLGSQVLPDFVTQLRRFRVRFDTSDFAASQEEESEKATRIGTLVEKGILRVDRAQEMLGFEVDPTRQVYLGPAPAPTEPSSLTEPSDPADDLLAIRERVNGNGRGNSHE